MRASPQDLKHNRMVFSAIDLANKCLNTDATRRITARDALYHPFLAIPKSGRESDIEEGGTDDGDDDGDDATFPHPFGEGVCAEWHWKDDETGEHCVTVKDSRSKVVAAGEGIAIGNQPCEFHVSMVPGR